MTFKKIIHSTKVNTVSVDLLEQAIHLSYILWLFRHKILILTVFWSFQLTNITGSYYVRPSSES